MFETLGIVVQSPKGKKWELKIHFTENEGMILEDGDGDCYHFKDCTPHYKREIIKWFYNEEKTMGIL